jgi:hypothetical protein
MMAATFFEDDEGELAMAIDRKKDCTESAGKSFNHRGQRSTALRIRGLEESSEKEFAVAFGAENW